MRLRPLPILFLAILLTPLEAQKPRARDLGIPLPGSPGPLNAITDVAGVMIGHTTLIQGEGPLVVGKGPVRTGVTAIFPRGSDSPDPVFGAWFALNGNGEMTGTTYLEENGYLWGPVMLTNTLSIGTVRDATIEWLVKHGRNDFLFSLPVVAETWDGGLNDIQGFHVKKEHVFAALESAGAGRVPEGNVGGGTGMVCHQFKGGIGTSSRKIAVDLGGYIVGVLVQCNYGRRPRLSVLGTPVGAEIMDLKPCVTKGGKSTARAQAPCTPELDESGGGSIIVVVATDAPLLPHQLKRLAKRVALGVGRMGGLGEDSSGDIFIAFSTANAGAWNDSTVSTIKVFPSEKMNPLFQATVEATEESILNAMLAAETMTGGDGHRVYALPSGRLIAALKKYGRM